jgi:hypothetical protein
MGNFTSQPFGKDPRDVQEYQKHFHDFGDLLLGTVMFIEFFLLLL